MAALFIGILVLWSTEAIPIAVTSLLALALQPIFRLTAIVVPPNPNATTGQMMGAAAANFISNPFFFVLVMFVDRLSPGSRPDWRGDSRSG